MSTLKALLNKLMIFLRRSKVRYRPDNVLLKEKGVKSQLLSGGLDVYGNPRIVFHFDSDDELSKLVDEDTLKMLDADWDEAKRAK